MGSSKVKAYCLTLRQSFTIRFVLRHDKVELLEKLKDEPLLLESKLKSDIKLDAYPTVENALRCEYLMISTPLLHYNDRWLNTVGAQSSLHWGRH